MIVSSPISSRSPLRLPPVAQLTSIRLIAPVVNAHERNQPARVERPVSLRNILTAEGMEERRWIEARMYLGDTSSIGFIRILVP